MAETKKATPTFTAKDIEENKIIAGLSYLWILSLIFLLVKKDSPFVQFHAKQGLVLFIISIVLWVVPVLGWLLNLVIFVFVIIGLVQALSGKPYKIPGVYQLLEALNL